MIIFRYLLKELVQTLLIILLCLLLVFLSHQLVRYLTLAAAGKMAGSILLQMLGLQLPYLFTLLLPLGFYLAIILTYGRLYAEQEMFVIHSAGLSQGKVLRLTLLIATGVAIVVSVLMLWVNPYIAAQKDQTVARSLAQGNILETLQSGRFQVTRDGRRVVYIEHVSRNHRQANNIFIAEQTAAAANHDVQWTVVSADHGYQMTDKALQERFIVATDGYRYEGIPGHNDYKIIQFKKYVVRLPAIKVMAQGPSQEILPTYQLWRQRANPLYAAELQWRLSIPLTVFILTLIAVPLSHLQPRQGRYVQLLPAILIYIIYVNLLFVARNWTEQKVAPIAIGMGWVHAAVLGTEGCVLYIRYLYHKWKKR